MDAMIGSTRSFHENIFGSFHSFIPVDSSFKASRLLRTMAGLFAIDSYYLSYGSLEYNGLHLIVVEPIVASNRRLSEGLLATSFAHA
jgi:hypothetical protein